MARRLTPTWPRPRVSAAPVRRPAEGPGSAVRILVAQHEREESEALRAGLGREGYRVEVADDGADVLRLLPAFRPHLVVLDFVLPDMSGPDACRQVRRRAGTAVIMVSAFDAEVDVVLGLESGAADYVTRPYHLRELVARVRALLRRMTPALAGVPALTPVAGGDVLVAGPVRVDTVRRVVTVSGVAVAMSRKEFDLLWVLVSPPGRVRTREELLRQLWSERELRSTRTLDVHIRRLRVKIEEVPGRPRHIVTVRGIGFRFESQAGGRAPVVPGRRPPATELVS